MRLHLPPAHYVRPKMFARAATRLPCSSPVPPKQRPRPNALLSPSRREDARPAWTAQLTPLGEGEIPVTRPPISIFRLAGTHLVGTLKCDRGLKNHLRAPSRSPSHLPGGETRFANRHLAKPFPNPTCTSRRYPISPVPC